MSTKKEKFLLSLEEIVHSEQMRRMQIIKPVADEPFHYRRWQGRAAETLVEYDVFVGWCNAYKRGGIEMLRPELEPLTDKEQQRVLLYLEKIGPIIGQDIISDDDIWNIAKQNGWREQRARNWLRRYQTAGPWGLTARFNPLKPAARTAEPEEDLGGLDEDTLQEIYKRFYYLELLLEKATNELVRQRVEELNREGVKISEKTLWNYLRRYKQSGLIGLKRKSRADRGKSHYLSDEMVEIIKNLRISGKYKTVETVWERACRIARARGEPEPSKRKVRQIISQISKAVLYLADGRTDKFKNEVRVTGPIIVPEDRVIIQIDTTPVNVLVIDQRPLKGRRTQEKPKKRTARLHLIGGIDMNSRRAFPPKLVYDRPDRFIIGAYIRQILLLAGLPDEIWTDRGKEYIARHVKRAAAEIGLEIIELPPDSPQIKGKIERLFETYDTRIWESLPGYIGRNLSERPPKVKVELTPDELLDIHLQFVEKYNDEIHSETGVTPNEYWEKHYYTLPVDPADLDIFLEKTATHKVHKSGVRYKKNYYWRDDIYQLIGEYVDIRVDPYEPHPQEIIIYHQGRRFGVARLNPPSRRALGHAQKQQRTEIRQAIDTAKKVVADLDEKNSEKTENEKPSKNSSSQTVNKDKISSDKKRRKQKRDPWEGMPD